jgi:penicillin V acylase-like amidase (Ntn superfamily)
VGDYDAKNVEMGRLLDNAIYAVLFNKSIFEFRTNALNMEISSIEQLSTKVLGSTLSQIGGLAAHLTIGGNTTNQGH